jgi:hypothetical protein
MKQNPEVLMDLIASQSEKRLKQARLLKYEDESPYVGGHNDHMSLPLQYIDNNPKSLKSGKNSDLNNNTYFNSSEKPINRTLKQKLRDRKQFKNYNVDPNKSLNQKYSEKRKHSIWNISEKGHDVTIDNNRVQLPFESRSKSMKRGSKENKIELVKPRNNERFFTKRQTKIHIEKYNP